MSKKLFLVETKMPYSSGFNSCYVVADNTHEAYLRVKHYLDKEDYGFSKERELVSVTLLADDYKYSDLPKLFVENELNEE